MPSANAAPREPGSGLDEPEVSTQDDGASDGEDQRFAMMVAAMQPPAPPQQRKKETVRAAVPAESPERTLQRAETLVRSGEVDAGLSLCHQVWPVFSRAHDVQHMGLCQYVMVLGYHYAGMLTAALTAGHRGMDLLTRAGDNARLLHLISMHAVTLTNLGQVAEAFELFYRGTMLLPSVSDDPLMQCRFWNNAATLYSFIDRDDQALECTERGAALIPHMHDPVMKSVVLGNMLTARVAVLHERRASWDSMKPAYEELRKHLDHVVEQGWVHLVVPIVVVGSAALMRLSQWDEARALLRVGHKATGAPGMGTRRARVELCLSQLERQTGQYRLAHAHVSEALSLLRQQEDPVLLAEVHQENCLLQEAQGHWRLALASHREYAKLREAWLTAQAQSRSEALAERATAEGRRIHVELTRKLGQADGAPVAADAEPLDGVLGHLPGRRQFEERMAHWREDQQTGTPLVLMIASVDQFKAIGARFNASIGRDVLQVVGQLMRSHLRPHDMVATWGREEFAIGFGGGAPLEESVQAAHRLREIIELHDWTAMAAGLSVTVSFGLTVFGEGEDLADALLRAAWALHESRRVGWGQVKAL
ncbi:GGDEF domain-containing protein [Ideonella sp. DXS29W]|uniref:diguanylate cyclase n=1 Tax=Ideonella lacteola TaxID=2984193 RepID=A0ABU9BRW9_9BURK